MMTKRLLVTTAVVLTLTACGSDDPGADDVAAEAPHDPAGACLVTDPTCDDVPGGDAPGPPGAEPLDEPQDGAGPGGPVTPLTGGGLSVSDVLANDIDGGFAVEAYYVADETGGRLCDALMESMPPQCGEASMPFDNSASADLGSLASADGVTWSETPVVVVGRVVDGVFVADPAEG